MNLVLESNNTDRLLVRFLSGVLSLWLAGPCSSEDRALASGVRCGRSSRPRGTRGLEVFELVITMGRFAGRSAAVARRGWDQEGVSSILTAPTS